MRTQSFEKKNDLLYLIVIMVLSGILAGRALGCPPVPPPCWPCCGDPGPCAVCTPGGWGPKCKDSECKYCKQSTGECLNKCKCGAPCTGPISCGDPPTACWYCDDSADDCGEGENCCAYGPDLQSSECFNIQCQWCDYLSGPQPVQLTYISYNHMGSYFIFYVGTDPWCFHCCPFSGGCPAFMKFDDGSWEPPDYGFDFLAWDYTWHWEHIFESCVGPHSVEATLCDSYVAIIPFNVCDTSYPTCEQCDPESGWCIPTTPCYGDCCNWLECQYCDPVTQSCQSTCNDSCCDPKLNQCCINEECKTCSAWYYDPPTYLPFCPDCIDEMGGCYGEFDWIKYGHDHLTGGPPPVGDIGVCGTPTKDVEVGVNIMCRPWGLNIEPIIACAIEVGSSAWDCIECVAFEDIISCWMCALSLIDGDYDCINPDLCIYVESCKYCLEWEEGCTVPIVETVVDWDKAQICYHMP